MGTCDDHEDGGGADLGGEVHSGAGVNSRSLMDGSRSTSHLGPMTSHLQPYAGPLTVNQIAEGIAAAQANALRLIEDARVLLEAGRFPTVAALAVLAIEERGKVIILKRMVLLHEPAHLKAAWKEYRSHRAKSAGMILPELILDGARTMAAMAPAVDADTERTGLLNAVKQVSLYTDCLGDRHWTVPEDVADEELARSMLRAAEGMWGARPVLLRELELWADLVGPHYGRASMLEAVIQFQRAMLA